MSVIIAKSGRVRVVARARPFGTERSLVDGVAAADGQREPHRKRQETGERDQRPRAGRLRQRFRGRRRRRRLRA